MVMVSSIYSMRMLKRKCGMLKRKCDTTKRAIRLTE